MPDAWTIIKENSTLASGDAWEHINNPSGEIIDGAGGGFIYSKEPIKVFEQEVLSVRNAEPITVSERVELKVETTQIKLKVDEPTTLEVKNG